jgi:hypothetical protein
MFGFKRRPKPEITASATEPQVLPDDRAAQGELDGLIWASNASRGTNPDLPRETAFREAPETPAPAEEQDRRDNMDQRIIIRFTPQEFARIQAKANSIGIDSSKYIRMVLNDTELERTPQLGFAEQAQSLIRIGRRLDDILVRARTLGFLDVPALRSVLDEHRTLLEEIYLPFRRYGDHEEKDP